MHRLRLTAAHDDDVRRGAILIGDALRVATLPHARSARHYVVRHLHVGRFARDAAPQTVALAIERRLAELTALAVPATAPAAAAAPAVWFDDEATAIALLATRVVAGPPPTEWFWRQLAGGALRAPTPHAILAACVAAAAQLAAGPRAVAHLIDRVERARPGAILDALTPASADTLVAQTFRASAPPTSDDAPAAAAALHARLAPAWRARLAIGARVWGADVRLVLVAALALVDAGAAPPSAERLLAVARDLARALAPPAAGATSPSTPDALVPPSRRDVHAPSTSAAPAPLAASPAPAVVPSPSPGRADDARAATRDVSAAPSPRDLAAPPDPTGAPTPDGATTVGGLLFLLRPLAYLDLPGWIDRHAWAASTSFAARLLVHVALDHGATLDDPLVRALAADLATDRDALRATLAADDRPRIRGAWTRTLDRWLRRETQLSLATIVRRPGHVASTRTHIDVLFRLADAAIDIRLAGLDCDPGWVPWLGRVVRFHYLDGELP